MTAKAIALASLWVLLFFTADAFAKSERSSHQLECGEGGKLKSFVSNISGSACRAYEKLGTKACGDSAIAGRNDKKISLLTPVNTYHSSRNSSQYDKEMVKDIIQKAIAHGQDPYLYLGIMMVESPVTTQNGITYIKNYGIPPLDAIAAADAMNCRKETERATTMSNQYTPLEEW